MADTPAPSPENRLAMDRERTDSMTRAGIGKRYHTWQLGTFGAPGEAMKARMKSTLFTEFSEGLNLRITGARGHDFAMTLARSFVLVNHFPQVVPLTRLGMWFEERRHDKLDVLAEAKALVITGFCAESERPFDPWLGRKIEMLLGDRMDEHRSTVVQLGKPGTLHWWSSEFNARFTAASEVVEVK